MGQYVPFESNASNQHCTEYDDCYCDVETIGEYAEYQCHSLEGVYVWPTHRMSRERRIQRIGELEMFDSFLGEIPNTVGKCVNGSILQQTKQT